MNAMKICSIPVISVANRRFAGFRGLLFSCFILLLAAGCASDKAGKSGGIKASRVPPQSMVGTGDYGSLMKFYDSWEGTPYSYGGTSRQGVDCSSFVQKALRRYNSTELPRSTEQQARAGKRIRKSQLRQGDLVFFNTGGQGHVGIYLGRAQFMHASTSKGVTISRMDNPYWQRHFWQARRIQ